MAQKFVNNFATTLAATLQAGDTTMTLASAAGLPALGAGDHVLLTLFKRSGAQELDREIVKVTAISGNTLTVQRAQEGTTAYAAAAGTMVEARLTAGALQMLDAAVSGKAPLASPALTGSPTAPTAAAGSNNTQLANTEFVQAALSAAALSPATAAEMQAGTQTAPRSMSPKNVADAIAALSRSKVSRQARTSNTALGAADSGALIDVSGAFAQTFAAAATLGNGWWCYIRNSGTGVITLDPFGSELIDGLASYVMYPGEARLIQCDGTTLRSVVLQPFSYAFVTSDMFQKPPGYSAFDVEGWGGGAQGGRTTSSTTSILGGGGGGYSHARFASSEVPASLTVTVGAGCSGYDANGGTQQYGGFGGDSQFGSLLRARGGAQNLGGWGQDYSGSTSGGIHQLCVSSSGGAALSDIITSLWGGGTSNVSWARAADCIHGAAAGGSIDNAGNIRPAGLSRFGGDGGAAVKNAPPVDGQVPGGGGGALLDTVGGGWPSGRGARGEIRVRGVV